MKICLLCEGMSDTEQDICASCGLRLVKASEVHFPLRRGEEDAAHPLLGALIDGKYRVAGVLGKGGMGTVFRAVHEVSLVPVALKVLHPRYAVRAEHRAHFLAEARKAASVVHEHSARILDVGEDADGTVYIAMEMVEGETLAEWIHQSEGLAPADVVDILHQVCEALSAAHDVGIVHRDLSPRNVMGLMREGRPFVKILDFGIAKGGVVALAGRRPDGEGNAAPVGFANPPYSAPEHLEGLEVDARADLYSLGVLAYQALTGRLPVEGRNPRELARATIEGRLLPLRPPSGTPGRLVRLITALLSRDPESRPASAREVMRELSRIGNPRAQVLRSLAVVSLVVTLPAFVVAHADRPEPYLQLKAGATLILSRERPVQEQRLRSEDLDNLQFQYGGFDPRELKLEAGYLGGEVAAEGAIAVEDKAQGLLTVSRAVSPGYAAFLDEIARRDKVELVFRVPGHRALAYGMVLVDDEPPEVSLGSSAAGERVLTGSALISFATQKDKSGLRELTLVITWRDDGGRRGEQRISLLEQPRPFAAARELLGAALPGVAPRFDVAMTMAAEDRVGNRAAAGGTLAFEVMDLAAPSVVDVRGRDGGSQVTYDPLQGARLRVTLDAAERDAFLFVRLDEHTQRVLALRAATEHEVLLPPVSGDPGTPFPDGIYHFAVEDAAGNRSEEKTAVLEFKSEDLAARLRIEPVAGEGTAHGALVGDGDDRLVMTDGSPVRFSYRCNPLYSARRVLVRRAGGADAGAAAPELEAVAPGHVVFDLPELEDGEYGVVIELSDRDDNPVPWPFVLHVLRKPVELLLPESAQRKYLNQLVDEGVLTFEDGRVGPGRAFRVVPDDARLLRGRIWFGLQSNLLPRRLAARRGFDDPVFDAVAALHGENVLAVELTDLLGRTVAVRVGDAEVGRSTLPDGTVVREVARFFYDPAPVLSDGEVTEIEYRQPAKIVLRTPLPFGPDDGVHLLVGSDRSQPLELEALGGGARLTFEVRYEVIAKAAQLRALGPAELSAGVEASLRVRLETPVRHYHVPLRIRVIRSTLQPVRWEQVASRELAAPLAEITMVPLLSPDGEVYEDPVAEDRMLRAEFRPMPFLRRVRNVEDLFLQSGEMTRAAYAALIDVAHELADAGADPSAYVHAWDPRGAERLRALRPRSFEDDAAGWNRALADSPERPVTGVDFFQAFTAARVAGYAVAGDPELFRLPMGLELELAALGAGPRRRPGALHGGARDEPALSVGAYVAMSPEKRDPTAWPPTLAELRAAGDAVRTLQGHELVGLDFGVREWVLDLPYPPAAAERAVLVEWLADHRQHLDHAMDLARGTERPPAEPEPPQSPAAALAPELARCGVVRGGMASGQVARLSGLAEDAPLPDEVPGAVRILVLRRDGGGLLDEPDPHLEEIGFRLAGGRAFVREARR